MGSHRKPVAPSRARITVLTAAAATVAAVSSGGAAQAAPKPTPAQVQAEIDALHPATDKAVEAYDQATVQRQEAQHRVNLLQDEIARQQAQVNDQLATLGQIADAQYQSGAVDPTVQLMLSGDPSTYLDRASRQGQLTANQAAQLQQLETEEATLSREKAQAEAQLLALQQAEQQMAQAKAQVQQKLTQAQNLLNSLTASQRARLKSQASAASNQAASQAGGPASSAAAAAAFAAAKTKLGLPYQWGGTGPDAYDCSGLMQWAYAQAGISLPRTTYGQDAIGTVVPLSQARVGDLVFFNNDTHVGMYAGNGIVLHAPHTGTVIKFESISTIGTVVDVRRV